MDRQQACKRGVKYNIYQPVVLCELLTDIMVIDDLLREERPEVWQSPY